MAARSELPAQRETRASGDAKQPSLVIGDGFAQIPEGPRTFLMFRAIKLMQARGYVRFRAELR